MHNGSHPGSHKPGFSFGLTGGAQIRTIEIEPLDTLFLPSEIELSRTRRFVRLFHLFDFCSNSSKLLHVETLRIDELQQDIKNANKGTTRGRELLEQSLRDLKAGRSILIDKHNRIIAGNKTAETAPDVGIHSVRIIETDGKELIAVKRTDLDLETDPEARKLAYADNRIAELDLEWDLDQLMEDKETVGDLWDDQELDELLVGVIGETSTEKDGQGFGSPWGQVNSSDNVNVTVGSIETRLSREIAEKLIGKLHSCYENQSTPIHETFEQIIRNGLKCME